MILLIFLLWCQCNFFSIFAPTFGSVSDYKLLLKFRESRRFSSENYDLLKGIIFLRLSNLNALDWGFCFFLVWRNTLNIFFKTWCTLIIFQITLPSFFDSYVWSHSLWKNFKSKSFLTEVFHLDLPVLLICSVLKVRGELKNIFYLFLNIF